MNIIRLSVELVLNGVDDKFNRIFCPPPPESNPICERKQRQRCEYIVGELSTQKQEKGGEG
jgi:hypothetical protein